MDWFTVQVAALDDAGAAATAVATGVRGAGLAGAAAGIGVALPGGAAQMVGTQLVTAWTTRTEEACAARLDQHAAALTAAAQAYRSVEELNAAALSGG